MKLEHGNKIQRGVWLAALLALTQFSARAVDIIEISVPTNSQNYASRPGIDNIWKVTTPPYPFNHDIGIGFIVRPTVEGNYNYADFALHQSAAIQDTGAYAAPYVPNVTNSTVTYKFDQPVVISGMELAQHINGVTQIEGFLGNSVSNLTSLGAVFGPAGDIHDTPVGAEAETQFFRFGNTNISGSVLKLVIRKTTLPDAFALYRAYPLDINSNRLPVTLQAPILMSIKLSQVQISWNSVSGKTYQVQYYTSTNFNQWSNLSGTITATTNNASTTDSVINRNNRIYRVLQLP